MSYICKQLLKNVLHRFGVFTLIGLSFTILMTYQPAAYAMKIQKVKSPGGIEAWLVEEKNVPLITMEFAFKGGAAQDPDGKKGVAYLISGMLDEGAGELNAQAFQDHYVLGYYLFHAENSNLVDF